MKKKWVRFGAMLLAVCLAGACFTGCGNAENISEEPSEDTTEDNGNYLNPTAYKEGHYYMDDLDECIKRVGRTRYENHMLTCDWSGTGFVFNAHTEGETMTVSYKSSYETYFTVYIDGYEMQRERISGNGVFRVKLDAGDHEISITKENEINIDQNSYCYISELGFKGKFMEKPEDKKLFIEVIGDSIACGDGCLGVFQEGVLWPKNSHSAHASFAAVAARRLNADYNLVSRGGIGIIRSRDEVGLPMPAIYDCISPYKNIDLKYDFARKPDLIIFELGANDAEDICTEDEYYAAMEQFLATILEKNGADVPIVWTGASLGHYGSAKRYAENHPEVKFYAFQFRYGSSGAGGSTTSVSGHPNEEEQRDYGEALYRFITDNMVLGAN